MRIFYFKFSHYLISKASTEQNLLIDNNGKSIVRTRQIVSVVPAGSFSEFSLALHGLVCVSHSNPVMTAFQTCVLTLRHV